MKTRGFSIRDSEKRGRHTSQDAQFCRISISELRIFLIDQPSTINLQPSTFIPVNRAAIALPKRLLRIKRQAARLAELQCLRAAARLEQAVQAERTAQAELVAADEALRERCRRMRLVEEVHASRHEIHRLSTEIRRLQAEVAAARTAYQAAVSDRRQADAEVEVLEKLLEKRLDELHRKLEQRKQQFADEWTMRRWTGHDAGRQEAEQS